MKSFVDRERSTKFCDFRPLTDFSENQGLCTEFNGDYTSKTQFSIKSLVILKIEKCTPQT